MRRAPALSLFSVLAVALTGCGASTTEQAAAPEAPAALVSVDGGVTDGRTGDAVASADTGPLRLLSGGGALDPSDPPGGPGRRDGVGAGDACPDPELAPAPDNLARVEATTLCLLNGERADHGLRPLSTNGKLARAALSHAADMVEHTYFAHEGRDGSQIRDRIGATGYIPSRGRWVIGENLAWGTGALATPKAIVNAWMNSSGHRANVLHPDYREVGFGIVVGNPARPSGQGATYASEFGVTGVQSASTPTELKKAKRAKAKRAKARRARSSRARKARAARRASASARRAS